MELSKILAFLCSAASYTSNAIAPCAIAALLGRFLPRLGPLASASGPFFSLFGSGPIWAQLFQWNVGQPPGQGVNISGKVIECD